MLAPNHRLLTVRALLANKSAPPVDAVMAELFTLLTGGTAGVDVTYAWELFENDEHRGVVDAFLLARAPFDIIEKTLGIPEAVVKVYAYLFLDPAALRNRLEVLSFASAYPGPASARELIRAGLTIGLEYLLWLHGVSTDLEPRTVVRRTMVDAFYRGMAHKGNSLTTGVAKEAHKWWALAVQNAKLLETMDPRATQAAYDQLRIALEGRDETVSPTEAPVPVEAMLH